MDNCRKYDTETLERMIDDGERRKSAGEKAKETTRQEGEPATTQSGHPCLS